MTGRKTTKATKAVVAKQRTGRIPSPQQQQQYQQPQPQPNYDDTTNIASNIKKEQPPPPQIVKKILKTENDEAKTLKTVFKSNPDSQMKEFIQKAAKPTPQTVKNVSKTPAENHPPAVAQELLEIDDDVADNLARLFKTSKSYKNA